jgi:hypothetical protein
MSQWAGEYCALSALLKFMSMGVLLHPSFEKFSDTFFKTELEFHVILTGQFSFSYVLSHRRNQDFLENSVNYGKCTFPKDAMFLGVQIDTRAYLIKRPDQEYG